MGSSCDSCTTSSRAELQSYTQRRAHTAWKIDGGEWEYDQKLQNHMCLGGARQGITGCCLMGQQASTSNNLWEVDPHNSSSLWVFQIHMSWKSEQNHLRILGYRGLWPTQVSQSLCFKEALALLLKSATLFPEFFLERGKLCLQWCAASWANPGITGQAYVEFQWWFVVVVGCLKAWSVPKASIPKRIYWVLGSSMLCRALAQCFLAGVPVVLSWKSSYQSLVAAVETCCSLNWGDDRARHS